MSLVKRRKPLHDIFNKIYMEKILEAYENFVKTLSLGHTYYETIPKQYQRAYCEKSFGKAFTEASKQIFVKTFSKAFDNEVDYSVKINFEVLEFPAACEMVCRYNLIGPLVIEMYKEKPHITEKRKSDEANRMQLYQYQNSENKHDLGRTVLVNSIHFHQAVIKCIHTEYKMKKYKFLSKNASNDFKKTFRERNLVAKNQYIHMLENILRQRQMEKSDNIKHFIVYYRALLEKLNALEKETLDLRHTVTCYTNDKEGSKRIEALTGLDVKFLVDDWIGRNNLLKAEISIIQHLMETLASVYESEDNIKQLKSNVQQLCRKVKSHISKFPLIIHLISPDQLDFLLDIEKQESLEKLVTNCYITKHPMLHSIAEFMTDQDLIAKQFTAGDSLKRKENAQKQSHKIDQLETKIIRHVVNTKIVKDNKNKECDEVNSLPLEYTIKNHASLSNVSCKQNSSKEENEQLNNTTLKEDSIEMLLETECNRRLNIHLVDQLRKLDKIVITWLMKHKPKESHMKYNKTYNNVMLESLKLHIVEEFRNEKRNVQMDKAAHQMTFLLNNLKMEFAQVNKNLERITYSDEPLEYEYSKSQAKKKCDTCKLNVSNIIDCTKYITHMLYEKNLNRFYILTTVMDQLSFLLYMIRRPIFTDGMSRRNQWSIKKITKIIIGFRNQLRKILGVKIDVINFSLKEKTDVSIQDNILLNQSNNKDILGDFSSLSLYSKVFSDNNDVKNYCKNDENDKKDENDESDENFENDEKDKSDKSDTDDKFSCNQTTN